MLRSWRAAEAPGPTAAARHRWVWGWSRKVSDRATAGRATHHPRTSFRFRRKLSHFISYLRATRAMDQYKLKMVNKNVGQRKAAASALERAITRGNAQMGSVYNVSVVPGRGSTPQGLLGLPRPQHARQQRGKGSQLSSRLVNFFVLQLNKRIHLASNRLAGRQSPPSRANHFFFQWPHFSSLAAQERRRRSHGAATRHASGNPDGAAGDGVSSRLVQQVRPAMGVACLHTLHLCSGASGRAEPDRTPFTSFDPAGWCPAALRSA